MLNTSQMMANYGVYSFFLRQNWNNWNWNNWILELQEQLNLLFLHFSDEPTMSS